MSPDDALDELRSTRDELSGHLERLAGAIAGQLEDEDERELMMDAMADERQERHREPTILSTANPLWTWYAVSSFSHGYAQRRQLQRGGQLVAVLSWLAVDSARRGSRCCDMRRTYDPALTAVAASWT